MILPLLFSVKHKWPLAGLASASIFGAYLLTNHFQIVVPEMLEPAWLDLNMPFMPNTVWLYISMYLLLAMMLWLEQDNLYFNKLAYTALTISAISILVFVIAPTIYTREAAKLHEDVNVVTKGVFSSMFTIDTPNNCLPSLHVSMSLLAALNWWGRSNLRFILLFTWAVLISLSTMTVKQHYFADVLTGASVCLVVYWFFYHQARYRS